jgi:2-haloacid dehalogenase
VGEGRAASPRLITFDVYTALLDYESSLVPRVREAMDRVGDVPAFVRAWRAKQLEYAQLTNSLPGGRLPFRLVTRRALEFTAAKARLQLSVQEVDRLTAAWDALTPWPEAEDTLSRLKARGYALGLLSNGDEDMLRAAAGRFAVEIDHVFASDHAGYYKPHPAIYGLAQRRLGIANGDLLHVAGSGNDVLGARLAGLRCAWSNRNGDPLIDPAAKPDYELRDLSGLLEIL